MTSLQIRPAEITKAFWRDRWMVIAVVALAGAASVAYALTRKPMFTSEALLATPEVDKSGLGALTGVLGQVSGLSGILGASTFGGASLDEVVAVLKSRDFTLRFIRNHNVLPQIFPDREWPAESAPPTALPPPPAPDATVAGTETGTESAAATANALVSQSAAAGLTLTVEDILDKFETVRSITVDRRTGFVSLKVHARQPEAAQRIAQTMINDINNELRRRSLEEARRAEAFLNQKIASAQFESIRNTAAALLETQLKREVMAESRPDFALRILDPASLPQLRSYPRRTSMVIIGGMLGSLVAAIIVLFRMRARRAAVVGSTT